MRLLLLPCSLIAHDVIAGTCDIAAAEPIRPVVELFTSEGCSSCPPADRWLSGIATAPRRSITALAYHVDYWDYLGWGDRFAQPAFGQLHQTRVAHGGGTIRYTPQVFVDGHEFTPWRQGAEPRPGSKAALSLQVTYPPIESGRPANFLVRAQGVIPRDSSATLVLIEHALSSHVRAGENAGRSLRHDAVVRSLIVLPIDTTRPSFAAQLDVPGDLVPANSEWALILRDGHGNTLQSLDSSQCDG
ncbi:MAG: DUF1223 domain-containing protein [Rhodocyclaceae bacterium]|nr:DUF1223 domain-containing protein [Rhodocyclaceae bacterium]